MVTIISPAIKMKTSKNINHILAKPKFIKSANYLADKLKKIEPYEIESLMKINPELALDTYFKYQDYENSPLSPAVHSFNGLVFQHLSGEGFKRDEAIYANKHLRILSGLYGVLRPYDGIAPYRLEMGTRVKIDGENLYSFWGDRIYKEVRSVSRTIINLASKEYSKCIYKYAGADVKVIDIEFLSYKRGKLKTIVAWAKIARGEMVRFIVRNYIDNEQDLKNFCWNDSKFIPELSTETKYTFIVYGEDCT